MMAETITVLNDYPIKINSTAIPFSGSMEENYETIETVRQSEAGGDIVQTARLGKLNLAISYKITGAWISQFEQWAFDNAWKTVKIYDFPTNAYKERTMRMRNYKKKLVKNSQKLQSVTGIWEVSFNLIER